MTNEDVSIASEEVAPEVKDGAQCSSNLGEMMQKARVASDLLKALSHETRLLLLYLLSRGEHSVTSLENALSLRQPAVSQQLARLRLDGLVNTRREGKTVYYRVADGDIRRVISVLDEIFGTTEGAGRFE